MSEQVTKSDLAAHAKVMSDMNTTMVKMSTHMETILTRGCAKGEERNNHLREELQEDIKEVHKRVDNQRWAMALVGGLVMAIAKSIDFLKH